MKKKANQKALMSKFSSVYGQLLFVWLAFFLMVFISYFFVKDIVHDFLAKEAEITMSYANSKIDTDLQEAETIVQNVSQSIRSMILHGNSADLILEYMTEITEYLISEEARISAFNGIYGFFDVFGDLYLESTDWVPPEDYVPQERPWYKAAIAAGGSIGSTAPYIDALTSELIISYSRRIFDNAGVPLGVVCVDVNLSKVADYIVNTRISEGGFGMLLTENLEIIATPSKEYLGKSLSELPHKGILDVVRNFKNGINSYELEVLDVRWGIAYVLFTERLKNGWYTGILTPVDQFYQRANGMRAFIISLGLILASALSFILYGITEEKRKAEEKSISLENALLKTMAELVEYRDNITGSHIDRTQRGIKILLDEIKRNSIYHEEIRDWDIDLIIQSSQLHDVGKIAIEDKILRKPGKLNDVEFNEMKTHTTFGEQIIAKIETMTKENEFLKYAKIFVISHHEKWDGTGYPKGLKGNEIPLLGRIMAVADVYDALVSDRSYKKAFTHEEAVRIMEDGKEKHFDPFLLDLFLLASDKFKSTCYAQNCQLTIGEQ